MSVDSARAVLGALASSMLTFIVFVFSILLVAVQLASAQLSPRIITSVYRNPVLKFSLTLFVFAFTYTLASLSRIERYGAAGLRVAGVYSCVACIGVFLYMIDHVGKGLRPVSILTGVGTRGQAVIQAVYPRPVAGTGDTPTNVPLAREGEPSRIVEARRTGVVLAFDVAGLVELARRADCLIELVPQVGDFVTTGDPLFRLYRGGEGVTDDQLDQSVAVGPERTIEQDPGIRVPHHRRHRREGACRRRSTTRPPPCWRSTRSIACCARSPSGSSTPGGFATRPAQLRLAYRTPDWEDFVSLAVTEIRQFGGEQHPDRAPHAGDAGEPDRGRAAATSGRAARRARTPEPRRGARVPGPGGSPSRGLRRFAGGGRNGVIAGRRGAPWVTCRAAACRSRGADTGRRSDWYHGGRRSNAPGRCRATRGGLPD